MVLEFTVFGLLLFDRCPKLTFSTAASPDTKNAAYLDSAFLPFIKFIESVATRFYLLAGRSSRHPDANPITMYVKYFI